MDLLDILLGAKFGGGSGGGGGSSTFVPSFGTVASVSLGTTWSGNDPYTSTVTVTGYTVTDKTMVSVLPSTAVLTQMLADGTSNIYITNNNGTLTATALGAAPTQAMTLTVLCSESDQAAAIGALPSIVGDGVIETLQADDLTDAVNQLGTDVSDVKNAIDQLEGQVVTDVTVTGTDVTIVAQANKRYLCGTVSTIAVTPCATGAFDLIFTSGSSAAILTIPSTVKWQDSSFDPTALDTNTIYEISVADGTLGLVASWT